MTHYEVHRLENDRWLLDAVFDDQRTAIDDARSQMAGARALAAVRVLRVEEHKENFVEWIVYDRDSAVPRATSQRFAPLPRDREPRLLRRRLHAGSAPIFAAREPTAIWALMTLLLLSGILVALAQWLEPKDVWLFDREEARAAHTLHNPWTGEASK
jgi:hypothetical protein